MKFFLSVFALAVILVSCDKKDIVPIQNNNQEQLNYSESAPLDDQKYSGLSIENGVLSFESIEYYESIVDSEDGGSEEVDKFTAYMKVTDFQSFNKLNMGSNEIDDDFVGSILNKDRIVKIGEWFILIDKPNNNVHTLHVDSENAYQSILTMSSRDIKTYSTDEDVLEYLANPEAEFDRGCSDNAANSDNRSTGYITYCTNYKVKLKAAYYSLGIYKKLRLEFWHKQISGNNNNTLFSLGYYYRWKQKCRNNDANVLKTLTLWDFQDDHKELKFYSGSRALTKYYIGSQFNGGATVAYQSRCDYSTKIQPLGSSLNHGY